MQGGPWRAKNGYMTNKQFFKKTKKADLIKFVENVNRSAKNAKENLLSHNIGYKRFARIIFGNCVFCDDSPIFEEIYLNNNMTKKEICENIEDFLAGIAINDEYFLKNRLYMFLTDQYKNIDVDIDEIVDQIYEEFEDVDPYELGISAFEKDYDSGYAEFFGDLSSAILNIALNRLDMCIAAVPEKLENYGISL